MSSSGRPTGRKGRRKTVRKPPPHWRKYLTQAELELPPPAAGGPVDEPDDRDDDFDDGELAQELAWWQTRLFVAGLGVVCVVLLVLAAASMMSASREREAARLAAERENTLTLRAINSVRALRVAPNPRSWSAAPDATLAWPEPPQMLELHLPVSYSEFLTFALTLDKVDHGRVLVVERMAPDSNKELLLSLNSSAFGPGEYRLRLQGYTWRGDRVDVGWVRLLVTDPR
jgi:Na+-transporting methylmalonyl-CoA/oxaloacetate decarboxylase gamma subunit